MKIYFFLLLLGISLETLKKIPNYSFTDIKRDDYAYLDISSFKTGDNIYLEVSTSCYNYFDFYINYIESSSLNESEFKKNPFKRANYNGYSSESYSYYYYSYYTFDFKIELESSKPSYLIITITNSYCSDSFRVKHVKNDYFFSIFGIIVGVLLIIIIAGIVVCFIKFRNKYRNEIANPLETNQPIYPSQNDYVPPPYSPQTVNPPPYVPPQAVNVPPPYAPPQAEYVPPPYATQQPPIYQSTY